LKSVDSDVNNCFWSKYRPECE